MREIKFRVWDKKLMHKVGNLYWCQGGIKWEGPGVGEGWCYLDPNFDWSYDIDRNDKPKNIDILMQWTGLKDCEGTDIYEGDIVQFRNMVRENLGTIEFKDGYFGIRYIACKYKDGWDKIARDQGVCLLNRFSCESNVTVVGNIYENPELLNY